jgi:hypothetical protein
MDGKPVSKEMSRRAFLAAGAGAVAVGWVWLRDRPNPPDAASGTSAPATTVPPATPATTGAPPATVATTTTTTTTSSPPIARIEALCRESWGAASPVGEFREHEIERMTVHHTARLLANNRDAPEAIRGHQRFHQLDRGWPDIAYHFIIDIEGNVYECRPVTAVGDTGTNYDPTGHFLVCCEGNFNEQALPAAQQAALVDVLAWAATEFGVDPETIRGHRDVAATSCPGDNLYPLIETGELARSVSETLAAGTVTMEIVCGLPAAERVAAIEA